MQKPHLMFLSKVDEPLLEDVVDVDSIHHLQQQ